MLLAHKIVSPVARLIALLLDSSGNKIDPCVRHILT